MLLHEDGTAVAFPEAVAPGAPGHAADRRSGWPRPRSDKITQGIEQDMIAALEEMLDALKKAQKKLDKKPQAAAAAWRPAAGPAADRPPGRAEDDPRPADAGQHPHRALLAS